MRRKPPTRSASSAAVPAASLSETPVFTSFAAATAQALPTFTGPVSTVGDPTPWDVHALQILKRLSKRDTTTKLRAIADLTSHINSISSVCDGIGTAFVTAFGPAFRTVINDPAPSVRVAVILLMRLTVTTFRRIVQPIFPDILPVWLAAQGDTHPSVVEAATNTMQDVLPTPAHRKKVVSRYAHDLCLYCTHTISQLSAAPDSFLLNSRRILAVLSWLLKAEQSIQSIRPVIDHASNPLHLLAKGRKRKNVEYEAPTKDVCNLAILALSYMRLNESDDTARAAHFADLAVLAIRRHEPAGWDLVLVLLRGGWHNAFGNAFGKLSAVVSHAVTAPIPTGLQALLPLFDALPNQSSSAVFAAHVMDSMSKALRTDNVADACSNGKPVSVSYALEAMPAYVETTSFVCSTAAKRWFSDAEDLQQLEDYLDHIFEQHVSPTLSLFLSGILPPVSKMQKEGSASIMKSVNSRKKMSSNGNLAVKDELVETFARVLRNMNLHQRDQALSKISAAFSNGLNEHNSKERLRRFNSLLDAIYDQSCTRAFIIYMIKAITKCEDAPLEIRLKALAVAFSNKASFSISHQGIEPECDIHQIVTDVLQLSKQVSLKFCEDPLLSTAASLLKDVGNIYGWVYGFSNISHVNIPNDLIYCDINSWGNAQRYRLLGEAILAHDVRKTWDNYTSWAPMQGESVENIVRDAVKSMEDDNILSSSVFLLSIVLNPNGAVDLSREVADIIAEATSTRLLAMYTTDALDPLIVAILSSPIQQLGHETSFHALTATAILRAASSRAVLQELIYLFGCITSKNAINHVMKMIAVLRNNSDFIDSETNSQSQLYAKALSTIISGIGASNTQGSVAICKDLLSSSSLFFTSEFLRNTPFQYVFGGGSAVPVYLDDLSSVLEKWDSKLDKEILSLLEKFFEDVGEGERGRIAANSSARFLSDRNTKHQEILETLCKNRSYSCTAMFQLVAKDLIAFFSNGSKLAFSEFERIPDLVLLFTEESGGACLESFKGILDESVIIIRRNALSRESFVVIDLLSSSLIGRSPCGGSQTNLHFERPWFKDCIMLALRSIRRIFEQPRGASAKELEALEMHGALLFCKAIRNFRIESVEKDDIRFWTLRARDSLESGVLENTIEDRPSELFRALCISALGAELVISLESYDSTMSTLVDEICHLGAWMSVHLLPAVKAFCSSSSYFPTRKVLPMSVESVSMLTLEAAARGILLTKEGGIPLERTHMYRILPHLMNNSSVARQAVFSLLSHAAAVDLPSAVSEAFPKGGFVDEKQELEFVTRIIPKGLRDALRWCEQSDTHDENEEGFDLIQELGFFLVWRLFLDLIKPDDSGGSNSSMRDNEDISFRRIGITYLRANPGIYSEFFKRCVHVVVDGSATEKAAAALAAVESLQAEEQAVQGIQLAMEGKERKGTVTEDANRLEMLKGKDMEVEVGRAAGIAFSRAWQCLPALSRQCVTECLDRGAVLRVESFVRKNISPLLIAAEIRKVNKWGSFGGAGRASSSAGDGEDGEGELHARGSVAGREVWASYTFSDVTLEIGMRLPDVFPLRIVEVEPRSQIGMSEARWRKTMLGMTSLLRWKEGTLTEAVELWKWNLDKTFQGSTECPICYSVLHLSTAALAKMQCRTCKNLFHSDCLCKWFAKSNSSACPLCRSAF